MKKIVLATLVGILMLSSCTKENYYDGKSTITVKQYVDMLLDGTYSESTEYQTRCGLPDFSSKAIEELLSYGKDSRMIKSYPCNPISSYHMEECPLGVLMLWTIESIRVKDDENCVKMMGYPSLNPLILRESDKKWVNDEESQSAAYNAYRKWWDKYRNDFESAKKHDPLEGTGYSWR
ncbi:MAG: DUF4943 family protein [Bacteroidales bacterium]|nr:DUF4943 family protein [Bacteroidales bacterium]MDD4671039.1 DUF4943 family protein [Bacteroidales bacterium]